ncbi:MAG: SAM-dependent methyltransferase [Elusimicrobia bacterium]|nr:SAM-dependent methyltransferase [Elusimicrobiota bacterium]
METALYDGERGFYAARTPKADFYTAPELHPAFARVLAGELAARLERVREARPRSPLFIVEAGSGDGTLARQLLAALREQHPRWFLAIRYVLIERVERLLLDSITDLQDTGANVMGYSRLEDMPPVCGVVLSNELIDALPVHVLVKAAGAIKELHVAPRRKHGRPGGALKAVPGPLSERALKTAAKRVGPGLVDGQLHSVCLESGRWLAQVSSRLRAGSVITIDYGKRFGPADPNPPRGFRQHRHVADLVAAAGRQDLTASADFTTLEAEGRACGLETVAYTTLSSFLIDRGILDLLPKGDTPAAYAERAKMKTLFHPEGMGEAFKVLIQEKGLSR